MSPFSSKLIPHFDTIRALRRKRKTWREVQAELEKQDCKAAISSIYEFFKRHSRRPAPLGWEEEEAKAVPTPTKPTAKKPKFNFNKEDSDILE